MEHTSDGASPKVDDDDAIAICFNIAQVFLVHSVVGARLLLQLRRWP